MPHTFVIFGASGDLTSRKLIPALYELHRKGRLPSDTLVIGFSRTPFTHQAWRDELRESTAQFVGSNFDNRSWETFAQTVYYHAGDLNKLDDVRSLKAMLDNHELEAKCTRIYYLATAPQFYTTAVKHLGLSNLADESQGTRRIVIEKPFGTDLDSAKTLNRAVHEVFDEKQIYRIDHYLGKETVQNILVLRFANTIFEPVWNRNYIDHVQITVAEEVTIGSRGAYYDSAGILSDMFQNHLFQLMMITAMECPARFTADQIRDEKVKILRSVRSLTDSHMATDTLRGQYHGYRQEAGVAADSQTETFGVAKLWLDNWRWQGVPFYLRSGKAMSCRTTQIVIQFRQPPHLIFGTGQRSLDGNRLVIQVQPAEGIQLHFQSKVPDAGMQLRMADLDFRFQHEFQESIPDAYQRLLLDAMQGDASLFARADEVELAWQVIDPILAAWRNDQGPPLEIYQPNSWGPASSVDWMASQHRQWFDTCPVL